MTRFATFSLALLLSVAAVAAGAETDEQVAVRKAAVELFDAMRSGEEARLARAYSERAWKNLSEIPPGETGPLPAALKKRMESVRSADVKEVKVEGDAATVTVEIVSAPPAAKETVHLPLRRQAEGAWRVDYESEEADAPFCLDEMTCAYLIWEPAFEETKPGAESQTAYAAILHGLRRGEVLVAARPRCVNVLYAVGSAYWEKLGMGEHRVAFNERVRMQTAGVEEGGDVGAEKLPALLGDDHHLLPTAKIKLAHLAVYEARQGDDAGGFSFGIPPAAIAYDYFKRAQSVQRDGGGSDVLLSPMVVDARAALAFKSWGEAAWEQGRRRELAAFGQPVPESRAAMEKATASLNWGVRARAADSEAALKEAIFCYRRAARVFGDAIAEYEGHLKLYPDNAATYAHHLDEVRAAAASVAAGADFLRWLDLPQGEARAAARIAARENYREAVDGYEKILVKFTAPQDAEDRAEYEQYRDHAAARVKTLSR